MKRLFRRIVSVLLVVVFSVSMITSATPKAAAASEIWKEIGFEALGALVSEAASGLGRYIGDIFSGLTEPRLPMATWTDTLYSDAANVRITTVSQLERARGQLEDSGYSVVLANHPSISGGYVVMRYSDTVTDPKTGNQAVLSSSVGAYLCNTSGQLIVGFASVNGAESDVSNVRKDIWLPFSTAVSKKQVSVLTKDSLSDLCVTVNQIDRTCSVRDTYINDKRFYVIIDPRNNIYANADGVPYVAHYEATVTDQQYDYIVNEGDTINEGDNIYNDNSTVIEGSTTNYEIVDNSQVIDMSNGTFTYIGEQNKEEFYIDELIYDFSSQSYQADTYNITYDDDTYTTNNFLFHTTYNITNVYITNIGQTELYEPLELYYVLPDGRSSADLTAEEVAGMSFEFADCVNYAKSATDTYLRALYHFDGNTDDSSYFSTQGKFEWLSGASISYMDVGTFDGALYLGPESHSFKITLPSDILRRDYSVQVRYYQAGAADTVSNRENAINIEGGSDLQFNWDDSNLYRGSSTDADPLCELPLGTWNEFAIIRQDGVLRFYLNGLCISSGTSTIVNGNEITFIFGNTSRAYSMIDELRVVNFAVVEDGVSYTPTSVPYDTNAVLVLPDSAFPIADEYWNFESTGTNLLEPYGMSDGLNFNPSYLKSSSSFFTSKNSYSTTYSPSGYTWSASSGNLYGWPYWTYHKSITALSDDGDGIVFEDNGVFSDLATPYDALGVRFGSSSDAYCSYVAAGPGLDAYNNLKNVSYFPTHGIFSPVTSLSAKKNYLDPGTYTLSIVNSSGEVASCTFVVRTYSSSSYVGSAATLQKGYTDYVQKKTGWKSVDAFGYRFGTMFLGDCYWAGEPDFNGNYYFKGSQYIYVSPISDNPDPIIYMELVKASSTDLTAEWVNCIYSSEEVKPNTAAIQTDIPIKGYTVGGVRPTFPARGDVWMPVSNNRISGVYIYNGSAWEEVNARWYTGTRWIPIYGFDITTLEDCWDIADIDTTIVLIGTESQFWSWLQGAWQKMLDKLDAIIIALGGDPNYSPDNPSGSGGTGLWDRIKTAFSDALASIIESLMSFITDVLQLVLDLVYDLLSFFFDFLSTEVVTGIANLFSSFTDGSLLVFFQQEITTTDEEGNEVTTTVIGLPDGVATAFAFFAGVIMILPEELRNLLIFGVGALILIGILKLAKS